MEWVDGVTLYDWARHYHPTAEQVLRLLAQVALARLEWRLRCAQ